MKKSTNLWILPKDWDEKQQIVLPSNENYEVINNKLSLALAPIRSKILKLEPPIAICTIQEILGFKTTDMDSRDPIFVEYAHKVNDLHYKMHFSPLGFGELSIASLSFGIFIIMLLITILLSQS